MSILEIDELTEEIDRVSFLKERLPSGTKEPCNDRAVLITEGYKDAAADPIILRRSKALANVLNKMTVRIFDEELDASRQLCDALFKKRKIMSIHRNLKIKNFQS